MAAALTQAGFLENRLREARQPPWSLLLGDRAENLNRLAEGPEPTEEVSFEIYHVLKLGFSRASILEGLRLLNQAGWSQRWWSKAIARPRAS